MEYEIRILRSNMRPAVIMKTRHDNDGAAIRGALRIARGRAVEVWRDMECVYRVPQVLQQPAA